jgi:hypothetical protein
MVKILEIVKFRKKIDNFEKINLSIGLMVISRYGTQGTRRKKIPEDFPQFNFESLKILECIYFVHSVQFCVQTDINFAKIEKKFEDDLFTKKIIIAFRVF